MVSGVQIAAIVIGAFYIFAGVVVMRSMALDRVMDRLLEALNDPVAPKEALKSRALAVGSYLTLASGAALALLSPLAALLFAVNAMWQGGFLIWAERALPPEDGDEARGRQQTKNAFVLYLAATAFVLWLASQGYLRPWNGPVAAYAIDLAVIAGAFAAAWFMIHRPQSEEPSTRPGDREEALPARLKLSPEWHCSPLWNADTGEPVSVYRLGLSFELAERIDAWDDTWQAAYNEEDPASGGFMDETARQTYLAEARAIVEALRGEWKGELEVDQRLQ